MDLRERVFLQSKRQCIREVQSDLPADDSGDSFNPKGIIVTNNGAPTSTKPYLRRRKSGEGRAASILVNDMKFSIR